ncbi:acyltransferase family protein [Beijerinckia indica]|uniref:Acyltransferase 3 n=1 Tax=Beijerinckia indica subsp. indica (strain ATCC 9039 / DSM 1715 / NCIMB 8712) TaxID=395963 RepID=B2IBW9_BEII9|nr:acyltransferase [Beijerinckia indica]ACB95227.1 acyltransferase 3 [Beijerinckia indica subsp. indica ATCC 9039]
MSGFSGSRIARLQYLRAIAALSVMLYHASYYLNSMRGNSSFLAVFGGEFGGFGVSLFFAISGFLMASLADRDPPPTLFLAHRLIRIYPIYWITAGICLWIRYILNEGAVLDPLALGLIPGGPHFYVLQIEWTLPFELTYYVIVFFIILVHAQRMLPALAAAWALAVSCGLVFAPYLQKGQFPTLLFIPLAEQSLPFAAGLLVPLAIRRGLVGAWTPIVAVGLLLMSDAAPPLRPWLLNIGCVMLVATAVLPRSDVRDASYDPGLALGDWSFALYLCHAPIIIWLFQFAPIGMSPAVLWFASIGGALCGAVVLGSVDMALYRWIKRRVDWAPSSIRTTATSAFLIGLCALVLWPEVIRVLDEREVAEARSTGLQIQSAAHAGQTITVAADAVPLRRDDALRLYVDSISYSEDATMTVRGWALDVEGRSKKMSLMVFHNSDFLDAFVPRVYRPDVLAAFGLQHSAVPPGFSLSAHVICHQNDSIILLLVTDDRRYTQIALPTQSLRCKTP